MVKDLGEQNERMVLKIVVLAFFLGGGGGDSMIFFVIVGGENTCQPVLGSGGRERK